MSDRATLFGLVFGAALLVAAALGVIAHEAGREDRSPALQHEPQLLSMDYETRGEHGTC